MELNLEQQYVLSVLHSQYHACWRTASALAGMVFAPQNQNNRSLAPKELMQSRSRMV